MTIGVASPPEIRLIDLRKRFGAVEAVAGIDIDIATGEFFSLLGPSGCGKTTTLRMIGGFEPPSGGRIELRGKDVTRQPPERRPVNMVFQSYALFPHLSVWDNVAFGLRRKGVGRTETDRRVGEALDLVHLEGFGRRRPSQLSGGQQQRVALARALVNRPQVLLLDEPLGALDLKLRRALQVELKRIQGEVGITFVYVTHDQEEALTLSDRIAVMHRGQVEQLGTPEELYDRPRTRFVAGFIGTTNLMSGTVDALDGDAAHVLLSSGEHCVIEADGLAGGTAVELSVRPEAIRIGPVGDDPSTGMRTRLRGRIEQSAYLGNFVSYQVATDGGLTLSALAPKSEERAAVGATVALEWSTLDALVVAGEPPGAADSQEEV
jgi:spermidine/putrescine transport system ATP-binding protein